MKVNYETLNYLMVRKGYTLGGLAKESGIDRNTLWNIRKGRTPQQKTVERIANVLEVEPRVLSQVIVLVDAERVNDFGKALELISGIS